ncbi:MAG: hypothetical protein ACR2P0_03355 [Acidimicrobiales bacterium]
MTSTTSPPIDWSELLPDAPFAERHSRIVNAPLTEVWPACLHVHSRELRTLVPLMALRSLPSVIRDRSLPASHEHRTLIDTFEAGGFVVIRRDAEPVDDQAAVVFGGVGKFWSPTNNHPHPFDDSSALLAFEEPGFAKTVATLEARAIDHARTRVITETRVDGTDADATRKFRPYWMLIRPFSGLIRRSWLAAIARRCEGSASGDGGIQER